jgi:hypothetical protein
MTPSTAFDPDDKMHPHDRAGTAGAAVIAILFIAVAMLSFAVDQSVMLTNRPLPARTAGR